VRVHQHLLGRASLPATERQRAQHALAQDFMKAGLFDRAEQAYQALSGGPFDTEARIALLNLYERSRDWRAAADTAAALERLGIGAFGTRIAHHWCELALEADARGQTDEAAAALDKALAVAPQAPRPLMLAGQRAHKAGQPEQALKLWQEMRLRDRSRFPLVAQEYAQTALECGQTEAARDTLVEAYEQLPGLDLLRALALVEGQDLASSPRLLPHLLAQPTLGAAQAILQAPAQVCDEATVAAVQVAVAKAARPLQRYRCAACGFEAQRYFWQCPGCSTWDSFPPRQLEEL
jgi:lipopolysaccharide biosynthesis regulator YciM